MSDDKSKKGPQDRSRVAGNEGYEVEYFARKHGMTKEQAQELIDKHGNNRETLDRIASRREQK